MKQITQSLIPRKENAQPERKVILHRVCDSAITVLQTLEVPALMLTADPMKRKGEEERALKGRKEVLYVCLYCLDLS